MYQLSFYHNWHVPVLKILQCEVLILSRELANSISVSTAFGDYQILQILIDLISYVQFAVKLFKTLNKWRQGGSPRQAPNATESQSYLRLPSSF